MRRQINFNTPINTELKIANGVSCTERHDTMLKLSDGRLVSTRRPGLVPFADTGTNSEVTGEYYWKRNNVTLAVSANKLYSISSIGAVSLVGAVGGSRRPTFAEFRVPTALVKIACGSKMYLTDGATVAVVSDPEAPQTVSHVAHFQQYAIANQINTELIHYNDALTFSPEDWEGELFSAEGAPDDVVAVTTGFDELVLFGESTVERYYNDGVTPFTRIGGATVQYGCIAPYSIQFIDNSYFFLTNERRVVKMSGSQLEAISLPVDRTIRDMATVSDAFGMHDVERKLYLLAFPTEDVTLVYDYVTGGWIGEWNSYSTEAAAYSRFRGNCMVYASDWGKTLVGDNSNGLIYRLDENVYTDNSELMRSSFITANISGNNHEWLRSARVDMLMQRGHGVNSPTFRMRYRDNGSKVWSNSKDGSIGNEGDNLFETSFRQLGRYKSRQYEFFCTDDAPFVVGEAYEDVNG